jgi:hypothetical protein
MRKWTNKALREIDDIDFARVILSERREKLNQNSPFAQKLLTAYNALGVVKAERENPREISETWSVEDVQSVHPELTDEQAMAVLQKVLDKHDASIGINWDVIETWARELFPETDAKQ